jgi:hypothetical protein
MLYKKNLDSFLTNILQIQSQAILQEHQEKCVIALISNGLAISTHDEKPLQVLEL